jgi:hypothetical protein
VGASLNVVDRVGVGVDLVVIAIVVLQSDINDDVRAFGVSLVGRGRSRKGNRLGMDGILAPVEECDVFGNAVPEEKGFFPVGAEILENNLDPGIEESELAEALGEQVVLEVAGGEENLRIRQPGDLGAGFLRLPDDGHFLGRLATGEGHVVDHAFAGDFGLKPFGDGIDALGADPMEATGDLIGSFAEFAAGVEVGHDQFKCRHLVFGMHVDRNAAAVILNGDGTLGMEGYLDGGTIAGEGLVNGVVDDLENAVMEAPFIGISDVHVGPLADPVETFQFFNF